MEYNVKLPKQQEEEKEEEEVSGGCGVGGRGGERVV